jgi:flavin reductase (DIM6/NTAB) family NADH-FMN oxidoreductase RutF
MAYFESPTLDEQTDRMSGAKPESDGAAFRLAMREFANGVALVATGHGDQRTGCTATSLCSLSLDPPSLLVCLTRASATLDSLRANKTFGISILSGAHKRLADRFAGRTGVRGAARFAGTEWLTLVTGAPLLGDALASIDCTVEEVIERHTHAIVIGRVAAVRCAAGAPALVHWRSQFQQFN